MENEADIIMYSWKNSDNQKWYFGPNNQIISKSSNKAIDIYGADPRGSKVIQYNINNQWNQVWNYTTDNEILNPHTGKVLDILDASEKSGAKVIV